ncbi:MAG: ATP-binding cassette domain-containing protein, partial [Pseudomonadota bacterium]
VLQVAAMGTGAALVLAGELTAGGMIAGSIILARALAPIEQVIGGWRVVTSALQAYRRLNARIGPQRDTSPSVTPKTPAGRLVADRLAYVVPGREHPILRGINLAVKPGEALGLIGPSGSGKSTLAKLLVGILPPSTGTVAFDGAYTTAWRREDMGPHVGYLPQDVQIFPGTVRDNIARYSDAEGDAIFQAANRAGVHDLIMTLPQGYDTHLGPGGVILSSGQQQRLGLARALFGDPCLIVLDEPDANLDPTGHEGLFQALMACREAGKTVILVTHRPALLSLVSRVVVLREGMVERDGPRDDILAALRGGGTSSPNPQPTPEQVAKKPGTTPQPAPPSPEDDGEDKPPPGIPERRRKRRKPLTITQVEPPSDLAESDDSTEPGSSETPGGKIDE